jgi:Trk K+ transport system NAD-binding subunit
VVIVGLGRVGRAVLDALPPDWSVVLVDVDERAFETIPERPPRERIVGDASSRLVLERCGLDGGTTLVAATGSDAVNREIARIAAEEHGVDAPIVVLATEPDSGVGGTIVDRAGVTAAQILNRIGTGDTRAVGLGLGKGELRQVTVLAGSPAIGRRLRHFRARHWLVGAIYRHDELIVPHGDTTIEASDQVLLVGPPATLGAVAAFFRGGTATFPSAWGARVGCTDAAAMDVARWLAASTAAREAVSLSPTLLDPGVTPPAHLAYALHAEGVGCLVVTARRVPWIARVGLGAAWWPHQLASAEVPVVVARGSGRPERVVVALGAEHDARTIGGVAVDLARQLATPLAVVTIAPVAVSAQAAGAPEAEAEIVAWARLHGVEPTRVVDQGNPIERIRHHVTPADLLVIGHGYARRNTLVTPDVSLFLIHEAPCSTVLVPWIRRERAA